MSNINPAGWSKEELDTWFDKAEWLNGWPVSPDLSIDRKELVVNYLQNKGKWDKIFIFLRSNNLSALELGRQLIDGTDLYAVVSEYVSKNEEDTRFEAHRDYVDLQYVISGNELMGMEPLSLQREIIKPYDPLKDVVFVKAHEHKDVQATTSTFFLFFPGDIHRPGLRDGGSSSVRKIVIKIKVS